MGFSQTGVYLACGHLYPNSVDYYAIRKKTYAFRQEKHQTN